MDEVDISGQEIIYFGVHYCPLRPPMSTNLSSHPANN
jgi:hypothetical protein